MSTDNTELKGLLCAGILASEGMPEELPLLVDSQDYSSFPLEEPDTFAPHQEVEAALSLDYVTPADTFMEAQNPVENRFQDDYNPSLSVEQNLSKKV